MRKTLIIVFAVLGVVLLACCGGGVAYILSSDPVYAEPEDPCAASVTGPLSDLGTVANRKTKLIDAHGRFQRACAVTLKAGDMERLLTVVIDVPADSDARSTWDVFRGAAAANAGGGAIKEVSDVGAKAYAVHTVTGGQFGFELTFYDGNLFVCLVLVSGGGLTPDEAHARLIAVADAVMTALLQS